MYYDGDRRTILKQSSEKQVMMMWTGLKRLRTVAKHSVLLQLNIIVYSYY
jgi:hypothetical protein